MSDHSDKARRVQSTQKEESRRKALRSFVASAAVSGSVVAGWKTPMVHSIILPAHAQTSVRARSLEDPCFLNVQCINNDSQIRVSGSGQVVGPADQIGGLGITLAITYNGVTQNRSTTTAANGAWSVDPVVFGYVNAVNSVNGVVSSGDLLFDPATCQTTFSACGDKSNPCTDDCVESEKMFYRVKTTSGLGWESDPGIGANDCIGFLHSSVKANGAEFFDAPSGSVRGYSVTLLNSISGHKSCRIIEAVHKAGSSQSTGGDQCVDGSISNGSQTATFTPNGVNNKDISHAEIIIECCPDNCR